MKAILNERARELRTKSTDAENYLWYFLRARRLKGYKFTRQFIIEPYIVDFVARKKGLIIELDGSQHLETVDYDKERTQYLEAKGYRVVRFWNHEVLSSVDDVLDRIVMLLE